MMKKILSLMAVLALLCSPVDLIAGKGNGGGGGGGKPPKDEEPVTEPLYEYVGLGSLGGNDVFTHAVNNSNDVVGSSTIPGGGVWHAFWSTSDASGIRLPLIDLNDFVDPSSNLTLTEAYSINDQGQIVGQGKISGSLVGFRFTPPAGGTLTFNNDGQPIFRVDGVVTTPEILRLLPSFAVEGESRDVNSSGNVVGAYRDTDDNVGIYIYLQASETFVDLGAPAGAVGGSTPNTINDTNLIAGTSDFTSTLGGLGAWELQYAPTSTPVFVDLGVLDENVSSPSARSTAMNNAGEIVGGSETVISTSSKGKKTTTEEGEHGFLYVSGVMLDIGDIFPYGINDYGDIVATSADGVCVLFADPDVGLINVNSTVVLPESLSTLADPLRMPAINDAGGIAGYSGDSFAGVPEEAFLLVPLP